MCVNAHVCLEEANGKMRSSGQIPFSVHAKEYRALQETGREREGHASRCSPRCQASRKLALVM